MVARDVLLAELTGGHVHIAHVRRDLVQILLRHFLGGVVDRTLEATFAAPLLRIERGELGTKSGAGFREIDPARIPELVVYRNRAYAKMKDLLDELGPSPFEAPADGVAR